MRVAVDVSPLAQTRAGTARYLRGLLRGLAERPDVDVNQLAFGGSGRLTAVARDLGWYLAALPRRAARAGDDVLHCPSFRGPTRSAVPLVVTVHDLAVLRRPETFNRWTRAYSRRFVPRVVRAARVVIADSEFTRRELVELVGVRKERIRVVPLAADASFAPEGERAGGDYVLSVATLEPRKNLARAVDAARRVGVELRVVGARGWGGISVDGAGVSWLGEVTDDELARLYRGALCLAYPSVYEGFGLPVVEAMACGTPVVTAAGGATEELAAGAAVLVDALDPSSIAAGIEEAAARRGELRRLGLERAKRYSWELTVDATVAAYREAAE